MEPEKSPTSKPSIGNSEATFNSLNPEEQAAVLGMMQDVEAKLQAKLQTKLRMRRSLKRHIAAEANKFQFYVKEFAELLFNPQLKDPSNKWKLGNALYAKTSRKDSNVIFTNRPY